MVLSGDVYCPNTIQNNHHDFIQTEWLPFRRVPFRHGNFDLGSYSYKKPRRALNFKNDGWFRFSDFRPFAGRTVQSHRIDRQLRCLRAVRPDWPSGRPHGSIATRKRDHRPTSGPIRCAEITKEPEPPKSVRLSIYRAENLAARPSKLTAAASLILDAFSLALLISYIEFIRIRWFKGSRIIFASFLKSKVEFAASNQFKLI